MLKDYSTKQIVSYALIKGVLTLHILKTIKLILSIC